MKFLGRFGFSALIFFALFVLTTVTAFASGSFLWTAHAVPSHRDAQIWAAITSSSDGTNLVAAANVGDIFTSADGGVTWTDRTVGTSLSGLLWNVMAASSDGSKIAAAPYDGDIYISTTTGTTWTNETTGTSLSGGCSGRSRLIRRRHAPRGDDL